MGIEFINNFTAKLTSDVAAGDTTIDVDTAASKSSGFRLVVNGEYMIVTAGGDTTTWTVTRGVEDGDAATSHSSGDTVAVVPTAGSFQPGSGEKIQDLNADYLDGNHASAFSVKAKTVLMFGADLQTAGKFMRANGEADSAEVSDSILSGCIARDGTINFVMFRHENDISSNNTDLKIFVDGNLQTTLTMKGGAGVVWWFFGLGISVSDGNTVDVEYDAGDVPGRSIVVIPVE